MPSSARSACRRFLLLCGLLFIGPIGAPLAETAAAHKQVPGYYRLALGEFEVTALFDGTVELDRKLLHNVSEQDLQRLLERHFLRGPGLQTAVNAYLVNTGRNLLLIDAGAAGLFGPTLGNILANMKAAGYEPDEVDTVLLTHLHADHIGGLVDAGGKPVFPKARIMMPRAEHDFWLSAKQAAQAPSAMQGFFRMAQEIAAPYQAVGRWQPFTGGSQILPGIRALAANGHTPGHTAYLIESAGQKLTIWGDLVHAHAVQLAHPEVSIEFDVDQKAAIKSRRALLKKLAADRTLVGGMHLPFPGLGHVRAEEKGAYSWVPLDFTPFTSPQKAKAAKAAKAAISGSGAPAESKP